MSCAALILCTKVCFLTWAVGVGRKGSPNFGMSGRSALGCIDADFCNQRFSLSSFNLDCACLPRYEASGHIAILDSGDFLKFIGASMRLFEFANSGPNVEIARGKKYINRGSQNSSNNIKMYQIYQHLPKSTL